MSSTSSEIADILKTHGQYDAEIIGKLEDHLVRQVESDSQYDSHANRTLIKLYQFFPEQSKLEYIHLAELMALVNGGSVEFSSLGCIISEANKKDERFTTLIRCGDLLDSCQFTEFWSVFHSISSSSGDFTLVAKLSESSKAIAELRKSILTTLSLTFKSTNLSLVLKQLDFTDGYGGEAKTFLESHSTIVENIDENSDSITFCDNVENTKRDKTSGQDGVDYGTIRSLVMNNQTKVAVE